MKNKRILVIGSLNMDMVIRTNSIPVPGETILGEDFFMNSGGKGANQAVASAKLDGNVSFIGKVGNDIFGERCINSLKSEGVDTNYITNISSTPSGVAMITVDVKGENAIVVAPGANFKLEISDIENASSLLSSSDFILMQLEIPEQTIEYVIQKGKTLGKKIVLNPAPAKKINDNLFQNLYAVTPNVTEAEILTGIKITDDVTAKAAARCLFNKGVKIVVITLGEKGALLMTDSICEIVPSPRVRAVDTTAAGDTFNGAFIVALSEGKDILTATDFACKAASLSVKRIGAQGSMPYRKEMNTILNKSYN